MPDTLSAFAVRHTTVVKSSTAKPHRSWAECIHGQCGWTGEHRRSTVIAEAEGKLHRLANCEHPGATTVHPLDVGGTSAVCTECGIPVVVERDIRGRHLILAAREADDA